MGLSPLLFSLAQVAQLTGVHRATLRRSLAIQGVEAVKLTEASNSQIYYRSKDIQEWLRSIGLKLDSQPRPGRGSRPCRLAPRPNNPSR
jgi:hypothetical protein